MGFAPTGKAPPFHGARHKRTGWPLSADDWDTQMLYFLRHGYRVIAHDRRGHGRSPRPLAAMTWITTPTTWRR